MGAFWSSRIYVAPEDPDTVRFDLRRKGLSAAYSFRTTEGKFEIPMGLGVHSITMRDPVELAQKDEMETVTLPVGVEQKRKIETAVGMDTPEVVAQLISGGGIVIGSKREDGDWEEAGRLDSDFGTLLVYGRISTDTKMVLRIETKQGGWFSQGGTFLVARAEGFVYCAVKVRFETEADRQLYLVKSAFQYLVAASTFTLLFLLGSRRPSFGKTGRL